MFLIHLTGGEPDNIITVPGEYIAQRLGLLYRVGELKLLLLLITHLRERGPDEGKIIICDFLC